MVTITCSHCGSEFEPFGDYSNYEGPVPCIGCHRSTWVRVINGELLDSKKWPM